MNDAYPPWVVLHVPHASTFIPKHVRPQFLLADRELDLELQRMTDHFTDDLFSQPGCAAEVVRSPVSRLVVDVERFVDDQQEPMAKRGMGAIYEVTSDLAPLRRKLCKEEREALLRVWYFPHHQHLARAVQASLKRHNRCLVLDCHSFPRIPLPYEMASPTSVRPEICIGTDDFHSGQALSASFVTAFACAGWDVCLNAPFSGALVPSGSYRQDRRVSALMIEVKRSLYMDEDRVAPASNFEAVARRIRQRCQAAIAAWSCKTAALAGNDPCP